MLCLIKAILLHVQTECKVISRAVLHIHSCCARCFYVQNGFDYDGVISENAVLYEIPAIKTEER